MLQCGTTLIRILLIFRQMDGSPVPDNETLSISSRSCLRALIGIVRDIVALKSDEMGGSSASDPSGESSHDGKTANWDRLNKQYRDAREALARSLQQMGDACSSGSADMMDDEHGG